MYKLFPGRDVPTKRYISFLTHVEKKLKPYNSELKEPLYIFAHSKGVHDCITWCEANSIIPEKIISLDGSYMINISHNFNIVLFRYIRPVTVPNSDEEKKNAAAFHDTFNYKKIIWYTDSCGHYPFTKRLIDLILAEINCMR
jgi:hypothetical protein